MEVPDNFWTALPVRLKAAQERYDSRVLEVSVERFLAARTWLRQHCIDYAVSVSADEAMRGLLRRSADDDLELARVTTSREPHVEPALAVERGGGRFTRSLRDFQRRDVAKLLSLSHGANFSVPGAGKTTVAYAVYDAERARGRVDRLLVVSPISAFEAWRLEARECFHEVPVVNRYADEIPWDTEVLLVNYQRLTDAHLPLIARWAYTGRTHVILDEAHRMKRGANGEWGRACLELAPLAMRRDILTGTPAPQSARDFLALIDFLWPGQARRILPSVALRNDPPPGSMELVSAALSPLFVRTTKSELDLPPPSLRVEMVDVGELQRDIYDALRDRYAGLFDLSITDRTMLAQMGEVTMYLLEAATNPSLLNGRGHDAAGLAFRYPPLMIPPGSELGRLVARYHDHEVPMKFQKLAVLVSESAKNGRKTLVWSNFVGNLLALERLLAPHKPALIYGAVPTAETAPSADVRTREKELARFRRDDECHVLLANPAALGEGVSLHDVCHDAVYLDRTFNAGQYLQSLDRIHRLGLRPDAETRITFLVARNTVDERVDARVATKAVRLATMLNDPDLEAMSLPDEEDYGEAIEDMGDLEALFEHLRGDD